MSPEAIAFQTDNHLQTPLHVAIQYKEHTIVELLLSREEVVHQILPKVDNNDDFIQSLINATKDIPEFIA